MVMYNMMDANSSWLAAVFFCLFSLIGGVFLLNVILAIIMEASENVDKQEEMEDAKKRAENSKSVEKQQMREGKNRSPKKQKKM